MATTSNFLSYKSRLVGTTAVQIGGYAVRAAYSANINQLRVTNRYMGGNITFSAWIQDQAGNKTYIADTFILQPGQGYTFGGDVLVEGDMVFVQSNTASSLDATLSVLEDTA